LIFFYEQEWLRPMSSTANADTADECGCCEFSPHRRDVVTSEGVSFRWSDWSSRIAKLNAPRENGGTIIEPPASLAGEIAAANQQHLQTVTYDVQGIPLAQLAGDARRELIAAAKNYTKAYRNVDVPCTSELAFLAGHQPEMFHPGVWFKNFLLAGLAKQHQAVAINLQIDSDALKGTAVRVPTGSLEQPRIESVTFDRATSNEPFEQRAILDRRRFESFGERATAQLRTLLSEDPLLAEYWPLAVARSRETNNLGACIAQARHQLEGRWGLQTLEVPQSQVCDLPAMRWLIAHLLAHLPRLWEIYNSALLEFRREHKVRSAAHPAPDLAAVDDWLEAPLWVWSVDNPRRRRLFVRSQNDELILSDRAQFTARLAITADGSANTALAQLAELSAKGIRIRTRALITTLAARLLLGDLFIHGIGGAKYDRLTDRILERFFGIAPPGYLMASGTLRLPVVQHSSSSALRELRHKLRELDFHPERFLNDGASASISSSPATEGLIAEKLRWISTPPNRANARQRCQAIRHANQELQSSVIGLQNSWSREIARLSAQERCEAILASRDYAFSLFPQSALTNFLLPILENPSGSG
jgi:hypothetical protein